MYHNVLSYFPHFQQFGFVNDPQNSINKGDYLSVCYFSKIPALSLWIPQIIIIEYHDEKLQKTNLTDQFPSIHSSSANTMMIGPDVITRFSSHLTLA